MRTEVEIMRSAIKERGARPNPKSAHMSLCKATYSLEAVKAMRDELVSDSCRVVVKDAGDWWALEWIPDGAATEIDRPAID